MKNNKEIVYLFVSFFLIPSAARGESRVAGATITAVTQVVPASLVDSFDDGSNPNFWGGNFNAFAANGAVFTSTYSAANALGGTGKLLQLTYDVTAAGSFAGCVFNIADGGGARDISQYKYLSFYVRSGASLLPQGFKIELINISGASSSRDKSVVNLSDYLDQPPGAFLTEVKIPLDAFANLNSLSDVKQINFVFESNYAALSNFQTSGVIEIDQLSFGSDALPAVRIDSFSDNLNLNALGGSVGSFYAGFEATHDIQYAPFVFHAAARSLQSSYNVNSGFAGMYFIFGGGSDGNDPQPHNFSSRSQLTMWVRKSQTSVVRPDRIKIELANGSGVIHSVFIPDHTNTPAITDVWQKYTIPLSAFTGLDTGSIRQMNIVYEDSQVGPANRIGTVYFDEIQFE